MLSWRGVYMCCPTSSSCITQSLVKKLKFTELIFTVSLNAVSTGVQVSDRYAMNLVILYVCFIYASGMPILLLLAALSFIAGYWADKFLFLRYYRYGLHLIIVIIG